MGWHFDATGDHFEEAALDSLNEGLIRHDKPLPPNMTLPQNFEHQQNTFTSCGLVFQKGRGLFSIF